MEIFENNIFSSSLLTALGVTHGVSTKILGNLSLVRSQQGRAPENFRKLMRQLDINPTSSTIALLPAKHTSVIANVKKTENQGRTILTPDREEVSREIIEWSHGGLSFRNLLPDYDQGTDAAISRSSDLYFGLLHADCAPILLFDQQTRYFSLVHAGVIGALTDILPATVRYLQRYAVLPKNLIAYIGPCICSKCYSPEYSRHYQHLKPKLDLIDGRFDLRDCLHSQLLTCGLQETNIDISKQCTACSPNLFFTNHHAVNSATEGRQMSIIGLKPVV